MLFIAVIFTTATGVKCNSRTITLDVSLIFDYDNEIVLFLKKIPQ